jgi:hypothetical protein
MPTPGYITLSHLWAASGIMLKLTLANLDAFLQQIPMTDLPPTFKDSFEATRKLGIRYLWIDSLCILQDSDSDWRAESSVMGEIYGRSLCNLAATGSSRTYGGLFQERDVSNIAPTTTIKIKGTETTYCVMGNKTWCSEISNAPLNNRGWVLQERMLSPRTLHYASQLFWECRESVACEAFPSGMPRSSCDAMEPCLKPQAHPFSLKSWRGLFPSALWDKITESYAQCELTRASDRLVAISGIAKELRSTWGDDYLAGLWKGELPGCLIWAYSNVVGSLERPDRYRCKPLVSGKETILIIFRPILVVGTLRFRKGRHLCPLSWPRSFGERLSKGGRCPSSWKQR